jgi:hypothetical protein
VAAAAFAALLVAAPDAATPSSEAGPPCLARGARYVVHHLGGDQVTTTYTVTEIRGVSCAFARRWVGRLTHKRAKHYALFKGVPGWYCGSFANGANALVSSGDCTRAGGYFKWQPKLPPPPPTVHVYTYDLEVVGSATTNYSESWGGGTVSSHWAMTARGLRIRTFPRNNYLPTRYRKAGWEMSFITAPKTDGTATATVDYSKPPEGCAAHEAEQFNFSASSWSNFGVSGIVYSGEAPACLLPLDVAGGPPDSKGLCTGLAGACWEFTAASGNVHFANTRKRPRPFMTPLAQILKGLSWSKTFEYHSPPTDASGVTTASVRFSLTRRKG